MSVYDFANCIDGSYESESLLQEFASVVDEILVNKLFFDYLSREYWSDPERYKGLLDFDTQEGLDDGIAYIAVSIVRDLIGLNNLIDLMDKNYGFPTLGDDMLGSVRRIMDNVKFSEKESESLEEFYSLIKDEKPFEAFLSELYGPIKNGMDSPYCEYEKEYAESYLKFIDEWGHRH